MTDLDHLERLHAAATKGSVRAEDGVFAYMILANDDTIMWGIDEAGDRDFTVALRNAFPAILSELRALREDVQFLVRRAGGANRCSFVDDDRDTGVSSNAIVRFAYGGEAPKEHERPGDRSDMMACQRAFDRLPEHRKTPEVVEAFHKALTAARQR